MAETGSETAPEMLNARQQRFVEEYIANGGNATQAAKKAGYSAQTAYSQGQRLLKHVEVARLIASGRETLAERCGITAERVLREVAVLGFSDHRDYLQDESGVVTLRPGVPDAAHRAISSVKRHITVLPDGTKKVLVEFKLWNKPDMVKLAGKHIGLEGFADRVELDAKNLTAPTVNVFTGIAPPADAEPEDDGKGGG